MTLSRALLLAAATVLTAQLGASPIQTNYGTGDGSIPGGAMPTSNLLATNLLSSSRTGTGDAYFYREDSGYTVDLARLYDGQFGTAGGNQAYTVMPNVVSLTFNLNLTTRPAGYDIASIRTYASWDSGRDGQAYTVEYSSAANPGQFALLATVSRFDNTNFPQTPNPSYGRPNPMSAMYLNSYNQAVARGDPMASMYLSMYNSSLSMNGPQFTSDTSISSTMVKLTNGSGTLASGVAALRFNFSGIENSGTAFREFIVEGVAPTTVNGRVSDLTSYTVGGVVTFEGGTFAPIVASSLPASVVSPGYTGSLDASGGNISGSGTVAISGTSLTLTGSTNSVVTLSGNISGAGILVNANGNNVISGTNTNGGISVTGGSLRIANIASLPSSNNTVSSGGTIILPTDIAFSGAVTIAGAGATGQAGALVLDGTGSSSAGLSGVAVNLSGNATVALRGNQDYTLSGTIAGTAPGKNLTLDIANSSLKLTSSTASSVAQLTKTGVGTLLVDTTGVINSGSFVVADGLLTNNGTINGGISVSSTGTLGGSGTINGAVTFEGGTFAPKGSSSLPALAVAAGYTGTLNASGGNISGSSAVTISGTSLTLTGSTNSVITLSGNISGAGVLVNANGNNVISGTNTNGGISVTGGSLRIANIASLPSSNSTVFSGATIILPTNIAFSGAVTIAGTGATGQAGALVLDGTGSSSAGLSGVVVNLSGDATVALRGNQDYTLSGAIAGTSPGKNLTWDIANHSLKLTSSTASSVAQLTKTGLGTLLVDTTGVINSGSVVVADGLLTNNGTINGGISVSSAGTLGGSGTINGAVTVAGTLSPGNSPGLQTQATGNTTLSSGSSYLAQLGGTTPGNGNGFHDQYYVQNGTFTIASNVRIDVRSWVKADGVTTFVPARRDIFAVIRANNGIVGGFSDLTNSDYSQWVIYENNSNPADQYGYLYGTGLTGNQTFATYGNTAARAAIGASLWSAAVSPSASSTTAHPGAFVDGSTALGQAAIGLLTTADTAATLDALSPEAYLAVGDYALTVSRSLTDAALSQAALIKTGSWTVGAGLNRAEHTYLGASDSLNYRLTSDSPLVAVAYEFSPRYSVGFFYGHNLGKTVADTARIDYRGSVFGLTSVGRFGTAYPVTLKGALVASDLRFEASRHGSTSGSQNLRSLGGQLTGSVELYKNDRLSFSPTLGYVLGRSTTDAFTESGTGANLSLDAMTQDSSRLVAGLGLTYLATTVLTFELSAAYEHEYASDAGSVSATFGGAGIPMTVVRAIEDRDSTTLGLGASLKMDNRSTFRLGAEVRGNREFRKDCRYNASVNVRF